MDSHLNYTASKIGMTLAKIRPVLEFVTQEQRKRIINSKVKSIALYGLPLIIGQPQSIVQRACAIIMRTNRAMLNNTEGLRSTEAICHKLNIDEPRQDIVKTSFKFIHSIIDSKQPKQITDMMVIPKRKTSKIYMRSGNTSKSPIHSAVDLFNAIPPDF